MQDLATSMSNYSRSSGDTNNQVEGAALNVETYVHVRWAWLRLLVVCVLGTFCFLLSAMISTRKYGPEIIWKSSALAALFHGFEQRDSDKPARARIEQMEYVSGMNSLAESMQVSLEKDGNGLKRLSRQKRETTS